jgi:nitrite reductase/ring-hydroxylating ferredoxin subunit
MSHVPAEGEMRAFQGLGVEICLAQLAGEQFVAFGNRCPHQGAPLSAGRLDGHFVVCPHHGWAFDVSTGLAAEQCNPTLETYEVRRYGSEVFVRFPDR